MAVDESLWMEAATKHEATLRFYRWSEPTLSLGYFQSVCERETHPASRNCPAVRRQSGGGAILHDQEWTYSLVLPAGSPLSVDAMILYRSVHDALIAALAEQGFAAAMCGPTARPVTEPFLCFQRRARGDVVIAPPSVMSGQPGNAKIAGSAQRRRNGALLQHGSLILRTSPAAPEIIGLCDLVNRKLDEERLLKSWQGGIAQSIGLSLQISEITAEEANSARQLAETKYNSSSWTAKRE